MHFYFHKHRNYNNTSYHDSNRHNTTPSTRNMYNIGNTQQNAINVQSPNTSDILGSLQSQILGLQMQPL